MQRAGVRRGEHLGHRLGGHTCSVAPVVHGCDRASRLGPVAAAPPPPPPRTHTPPSARRLTSAAFLTLRDGFRVSQAGGAARDAVPDADQEHAPLRPGEIDGAALQIRRQDGRQAGAAAQAARLGLAPRLARAPCVGRRRAAVVGAAIAAAAHAADDAQGRRLALAREVGPPRVAPAADMYMLASCACGAGGSGAHRRAAPPPCHAPLHLYYAASAAAPAVHAHSEVIRGS